MTIRNVKGHNEMNTIEVSELTKRYGKVTAVDDLSFTVERGSITGFIGPNGAGKTTTLRLMLGLALPDRGTARFDGRTYRELENPSAQVGAVLEPGGFHPARTARSHLRALAHGAGIDERRVDEVLEQVALDDAADRRAGGFSLGMRQRLGLAAALLGRPSILLLDEPANGLDPAGIRWLRELLRSQADDGTTVLVSSHVLAELAQSIDHAVIINRGRLVTSCPIDELHVRSGQAAQVRTGAPDRLLAALAAQGVAAETISPDMVRVSGSTDLVEYLARAAGVPVYEITPSTSNLEDVVLSLIASDASATTRS